MHVCRKGVINFFYSKCQLLLFNYPLRNDLVFGSGWDQKERRSHPVKTTTRLLACLVRFNLEDDLWLLRSTIWKENLALHLCYQTRPSVGACVDRGDERKPWRVHLFIPRQKIQDTAANSCVVIPKDILWGFFHPGVRVWRICSSGPGCVDSALRQDNSLNTN